MIHSFIQEDWVSFHKGVVLLGAQVLWGPKPD